VLLTKEALQIFEAERDRELRERAWTGERYGWLALARGVMAPEKRVAHLEAAAPSEAVVAASKDLFMSTAERAVREARRDKRWREVARIRREQAAALYRESGSPIPPSEEVLALHRAWSEAALRSLMGFGAQAELVSVGCCPTCQRDDGRAFRIAAELKANRLPHAGCPKGLCQCDWWPLPDSKKRAKRARRPAAAKEDPNATAPSGLADSAAASSAPSTRSASSAPSAP
jgi:hypothetical protein